MKKYFMSPFYDKKIHELRTNEYEQNEQFGDVSISLKYMTYNHVHALCL